MKLYTGLPLACILTMLLCACESEKPAEQVAPEPASESTAPATSSSAPDAAVETADSSLPERGDYLIDISPGQVVIRANQVDEPKILAGLAGEAGFQVMTGKADWQAVTVDIQAETLHDALVELVGAHPYRIVYAPDTDNQQQVLSRLEVGEPPFTELQAAVADSAAEPAASTEGEGRQQEAYLLQLRDSSVEKRVIAAKKIKARGEALELLTDMIRNDPSPEVRIATTWSLEKSEDPAAMQALIDCLNDPNNQVVIECMESLEYAGDESTVEHLEPLLDHPDTKVRMKAFESIKFLQ